MDRPRERKQSRNVDGDGAVASPAMADLPSPILMDIFLRLPIKAVMALRCVSKSLLKLVSEPYFKELYSTRAPTELLIRKWDLDHLPLSTLYTAEPVFQDDSSVHMKVSVMLDLPSFRVRPRNDIYIGDFDSKLNLVNTCNGLVCYCGSYRNMIVVICNPFTGEYVTIPGPDRKDRSFEIVNASYGLGFSRKDNRFKLLRVLHLRNGRVDFMMGEVYTFGESGAWKSVANCPNRLHWPRRPTFYKGAAHWYQDSFDDVVTFDFDTEQFGSINPPPIGFMGMDGDGLSRLCVLGDWLLMTGFTLQYFEVWVMEEYGVQSSWKKAISMPMEWYEPVEYLRNRKFIMLNRNHKVVCYNPSTGSVRRINGCLSTCEASSIKPSLVPLKVMLGDNMDVWSANCQIRERVRNPNEEESLVEE